MEKPYYDIDNETRHIVLELYNKCKELKLGNISFEYYWHPEHPKEARFHLTQYKNYWELVVKIDPYGKTTYTDIYKLIDEEFTYMYSE